MIKNRYNYLPSKTSKVKKDLKQRHHNQKATSRKPKGQFLKKKKKKKLCINRKDGNDQESI